jgi:MoxR-like ATPase
MDLAPRCKAVLELARAALPTGIALDARLLLAALCHTPELEHHAPLVAAVLPQLERLHEPLDTVPMIASIAQIFEEKWPPRQTALTLPELLLRVIKTDEGRNCFRECGMTYSEIDGLIASLNEDHGKELLQMERAELLERIRHIRVSLIKHRSAAATKARAGLERLARKMGFTLAELETAPSQAFPPCERCTFTPEHEIHKLGNDLYGIQRFTEAVYCYTIVLLLDSSLLESYFNRSLAHTRLQNYSRAARDLTEVIRLNSELPEAHYTLGLVHEYARRFGKAIKCYHKALELDSNYERAKKQLKKIREKQARQADASREDKSMRGSDPDSAHDAERLAKRQEAEALRAALEEFKQDPQIRWRGSSVRKRFIRFFQPYYGDLLTSSDLENPALIDVERTVETIYCTRHKITRKNIIILGQAGIGKTAVIRELAYRIVHCRKPFTDTLNDVDIVELVPARVHANTKYVGTYEEKIENLLSVISICPHVIVFIDEIHAFLRASVTWEQDLYWRGNQLFKKYLAEGSVSFIGCTTPAEYRHYIESDKALARRFTLLKLDPPTPKTTLAILKRQRQKLAKHHGVTVTDEALGRIVELTEDYLPGRYQPDKSIQLLEESLSRCKLRKEKELTSDAAMIALEDMIGHPPLGIRSLTEEDICSRLQHKIRGQDGALRGISRAVITGLGGWLNRNGPRGVFFFGGPTGVGKTETAIRLAKILGGGQDILIRIDCNTLQGYGWNSEEIIRRLIGPPPGSSQYVLGMGGVLSAVRDLPESVILFDEFEKADPTVARLLLQVIDSGRLKDPDDNVLDFRRTFIILTTNLGFGHPACGVSAVPERNSHLCRH